jgi:outer membrane protein insertion porin family
MRMMKNREDKPLRTDVLFDRDLEAIRGRYADAGYFEAEPGPVSMSFRDSRASLEITVTEGPKVSVSFSGNSELSDRKLGRLLLFRSEHDASDAVIESSAEKIRDAYRERGFADADVEAKKKEAAGEVHLEFAVSEGPRVTVEEIAISGNSAFTAKQIKGMMNTRESGVFRSRPFREDLLEADVQYITDQYAARGYLSAEARPTVTRIADGTKVLVGLKISEGRQTLTGTVSFEGNSAIAEKELFSAVKLHAGMPFSERSVEEDRYRILSLYSAKGYLYAGVEAEKKPHFGAVEDVSPEVVHVTYKITEDRQVRIGRVILRGNVQTKDYVIMRELRPRTGEPYNYEEILRSQQRVYRYGYFNLARFEPVRPAMKEYEKDMLFTVRERPAGAVEFGVGYGDLDRLRGFAEVSHRNLWGTARYASFRVEESDILTRAVFNYQEPWFLGYRLDSRFSLAWSHKSNINQDTREIFYRTRKTSAAYGVEKTFNGLKTSLTYQYENVENIIINPQAQLAPEDSDRVLISSLSPAVVWDRRDDPFNPRRGSIHGVIWKEAMKELGSEADFTKLTVQSTWFVPAADYAVIALSGRAGWAWPHEGTLVIPIHERFYLGGSTTVRGFTQDSVGPFRVSVVDGVVTRVPTGGSSMVQLNAELRLTSVGGLGVVFFTDAGNVWTDHDIRLNDLRASYGIGLRYQTPVGPLRVDYGQKIHRRGATLATDPDTGLPVVSPATGLPVVVPGESPGELHFNIGHAF